MNHPADNGPTIAFDEFGPLEIRPQHGRHWGRWNRRLPATYRRTHGVRHWLAFYDVHENRLWGYLCRRKRSCEVLEVLKRLRRRYPLDRRIHLILDNFSPHATRDVRQWCFRHNVHLIWTPTNASWLNPIECRFTAVKEFVIRNSNYANHAELAKALTGYCRYRNRHARRNS